MRYRTVGVFIITLGLLLVMKVNAAEGGILFRVSDVYDEVGSAVRLAVQVENNTGFSSFTIDVSYDSAKLKPVAVTKGSMLSGILIANLNYSDNTVRLVYASADDAAENGTAFFVEFEPLSKKAIKTDVEPHVEFLGDARFAHPNYRTQSGCVELVETTALLESYVAAVSADGGAYRVRLGWRNKHTKPYEEVHLLAAAYDSDGRLVALRGERRTLYPAEAYEVTWEFPGGAAAERVKLFTLRANMQPLLPANEKLLHETEGNP